MFPIYHEDCTSIHTANVYRMRLPTLAVLQSHSGWLFTLAIALAEFVNTDVDCLARIAFAFSNSACVIHQ